MSVELVQDLIKKLADELNSTTAAERAEKLLPASVTEAMIGHSVAALQATARTMPGPHADLRAAPSGAQAPAGGVPSWWPTAEPATGTTPGAPRPPGTPPALNPQLARIAEAVAAERMEVLLEPIHALAEGRARHFEVSVRLLTADGGARRAKRDRTRRAGLRPDVAHRRRQDDPRRAGGAAARRARPARLGAGNRGRRLAHRRRLRRLRRWRSPKSAAT